ncbi:MAG: hypothetical protein ACYDCQ_16495 [Dehalococcoidia bacterium]
MSEGFVERNSASLSQLRSLLKRLTREDLDGDLGGGWTVKSALMHLAFWDRFAGVLVEDWSRSGFKRDEHDADHLNLAAMHGWLAAAPELVAAEVIAAAETANSGAAAVAAALRATIVAGGEGWVLERSAHRAEHIAQIETVLSNAR